MGTATLSGAQTWRGSGAGPVRDLLAGKASPASFVRRRRTDWQSVLPYIRRNDERVVDVLLLKAQNLRKTNSGQQLHIEQLLHRRLELQEADVPAAGQVHHRHAALEFFSMRGQGHAVHYRSRPDLGQA